MKTSFQSYISKQWHPMYNFKRDVNVLIFCPMPKTKYKDVHFRIKSTHNGKDQKFSELYFSLNQMLNSPFVFGHQWNGM